MKLSRAPDVSEALGPRLWLVLARAHGAMSAYLEGCISAEGLRLCDFMVLGVLLHKGPMAISAIGEKVLLAGASMTSAVDRLQERSLWNDSTPKTTGAFGL